MHRQFNIAVIGASGAIGNELLKILDERNFPIGKLRLLFSGDSEGSFLEFGGEEILEEPLGEDAFQGIDIAFFCAEEEISRTFCPVAAKVGAVCIDLSSAWALDSEVPLVVPEVNPGDVAMYRNRGIIASPRGAVIQMVMALKPLYDFSRIRRVVASTYQAVSDSGQEAIDELRVQVGELINGRPVETEVYPHQIAFNCLPHVDAFQKNGYTGEEMRMGRETRKILGDRDIGVTVTAVRVPVFYGHSESLNVETEDEISSVKARELLAAAPGVRVVDDVESDLYPLALDAAGQDFILVGRVRDDETIPHGLNLWVVGDNLRKGAALNVVQIAELLLKENL